MHIAVRHSMVSTLFPRDCTVHGCHFNLWLLLLWMPEYAKYLTPLQRSGVIRGAHCDKGVTLYCYSKSHIMDRFSKYLASHGSFSWADNLSWSQWRHILSIQQVDHAHTSYWTQDRLWSQGYSAKKLSLGCTSSHHTRNNTACTHTRTHCSFFCKAEQGDFVGVFSGERVTVSRCHFFCWGKKKRKSQGKRNMWTFGVCHIDNAKRRQGSAGHCILITSIL